MSTLSLGLGPYRLQPLSFSVDLGVCIEFTLKSSLHCAQIAGKANNAAQLIMKCFLSRIPAHCICAFKVCASPV